MKLWIRSQSKISLINTLLLFVDITSIYSYVDGNRLLLGVYKSNERAIEVLDEIQKLLMPRVEYDFDTGGIKTIYSQYEVYEMPKE